MAHGLAQLPDTGVVGVHDAVRPFPSVDTIRTCFETAAQHGSAVPVVPVKDSLRQVRSEQASVAVDRSVMRAVQTPQCFDLALLKAAFNMPYQDQFTDDASVVEAAGHPVTLCEGDPWNVKVTTPEDLVIAEAFVEASWGQASEGPSADL